MERFAQWETTANSCAVASSEANTLKVATRDFDLPGMVVIRA